MIVRADHSLRVNGLTNNKRIFVDIHHTPSPLAATKHMASMCLCVRERDFTNNKEGWLQMDNTRI